MTFKAEPLQSMIGAGVRLTAYCHNYRCNHRQEIDLAGIMEKVGPDFVLDHDDLLPRLFCTACDGKKVGILPSDPRKRNLYNQAKNG